MWCTTWQVNSSLNYPPLFSLWTESACFKKQEELPEKEETCFLPRPLRGRKECLYAVSSLFLFSSPVRHFIPNFLFVIGPPFIPRPTSYSREGGIPVKGRRGLLRNGTRGVYAQRPLQKIYSREKRSSFGRNSRKLAVASGERGRR